MLCITARKVGELKAPLQPLVMQNAHVSQIYRPRAINLHIHRFPQPESLPGVVGAVLDVRNQLRRRRACIAKK